MSDAKNILSNDEFFTGTNDIPKESIQPHKSENV